MLDVPFTTEWHGHTVFRITPPGVHAPLYQRSRLDPNDVPQVEKTVTPIGFHQ